MKNSNQDLKLYAAGRGVRLWEVGQALGYSHPESFSRALRSEFTQEKRAAFTAAVDEIANNREEA